MSLLVIRHAHAGKRAAWDGPDVHRPLSARGEQQAEALAARFADAGTKRILSSPAVRCTATVEPLAARAGVEVEVDDRLFEGASDADIAAVLRDIEHDEAAVCTHGDIIPMVLDRLMTDGMEPAGELRWSKASTWSIERTDDGWGRGTYLPPPGR